MNNYYRGTCSREVNRKTPLERAELELARLNKTIEILEKRKTEVIAEIERLKAEVVA